MSTAAQSLIARLKAAHEEISRLEAAALVALYQDKDQQRHRELMRERAERIAALDREHADLVEALPEPPRHLAAGKLRRFSAGAGNALDLDSIFYMTALLYPDEHKSGEPDNLELLIRELENAPRPG